MGSALLSAQLQCTVTVQLHGTPGRSSDHFCRHLIKDCCRCCACSIASCSAGTGSQQYLHPRPSPALLPGSDPMADGVFDPPQSIAEKAHVKSWEQYDALYKQSLDSPDEFWGAQADKFTWRKRWSNPVCT